MGKKKEQKKFNRTTKFDHSSFFFLIFIQYNKCKIMCGTIKRDRNTTFALFTDMHGWIVHGTFLYQPSFTPHCTMMRKFEVSLWYTFPWSKVCKYHSEINLLQLIERKPLHFSTSQKEKGILFDTSCQSVQQQQLKFDNSS